MKKMVVVILFLVLVLLLQPVVASKSKLLIGGGIVVAGAIGAVGTYLGVNEETVNLYVINISDDRENLTENVNQRFVLDPDEPPESPERNIFVDNVKPIKALGLKPRLFWIRVDGRKNDLPIIGAFSPARFTVGGPLIAKITKSGEIPEKSIEIAHGENGTLRFSGLMQVKINKPDWEASAVGIEGFTVTFEKAAIDTLIQGVQSSQDSASEVAARLAGKAPPQQTTTPTTTPQNPPEEKPPEPAPPTNDKWYIIE